MEVEDALIEGWWVLRLQPRVPGSKIPAKGLSMCKEKLRSLGFSAWFIPKGPRLTLVKLAVYTASPEHSFPRCFLDMLSANRFTQSSKDSFTTQAIVIVLQWNSESFFPSHPYNYTVQCKYLINEMNARFLMFSENFTARKELQTHIYSKVSIHFQVLPFTFMSSILP